VNIPVVVENKARAVNASAWLDDLPAIVRSIEHDWELSVGTVFSDATEALVAEVQLATGEAAVLKLVIPRGDGLFQHEATVLRLAGGDGCVRLLRTDDDRSALLLERLGPSLHELGMPLDDRPEVLCSVAERVWRPAPEVSLPSGASKARRLAEFIEKKWEDLDRPCSRRAVDHALACAARRAAAHDDERAVLVHGDVHEWNALRAPHAPGGFKLVDPDGLLAEREYDLGVMMREDPVELLNGDPWERARRLALRCGADAVAIWEWGAAERIATGLLGTEVALQPVAGQMLAAAEVCAVAST
jgi:streptomycin 6-kinase